MNRTNETALETVIEAHLIQHCYMPIVPKGIDRERNLGKFPPHDQVEVWWLRQKLAKMA